MRELKYGGDSIKSSGTRLAIIDSGTSFITISETDFKQFASKVVELEDMECSYSGGCSSPDGKWCDQYIPLLEDL